MTFIKHALKINKKPKDMKYEARELAAYRFKTREKMGQGTSLMEWLQSH